MCGWPMLGLGGGVYTGVIWVRRSLLLLLLYTKEIPTIQVSLNLYYYLLLSTLINLFHSYSRQPLFSFTSERIIDRVMVSKGVSHIHVA